MLVFELPSGLSVRWILVDLALLIIVIHTLEPRRRAVISAAGCGFLRSSQCGGWWRRASSYAAWLGRVGMMLVWRMGIARARRRWPVLGNWSYLWRRAAPSSKGRHGPLWCAMHCIRGKRHRTGTGTGTRGILRAAVGIATLGGLRRRSEWWL